MNESNVKRDAYYKLHAGPESQIKSYIEDALRSSVSADLDELFEKSDERALIKTSGRGNVNL